MCAQAVRQALQKVAGVTKVKVIGDIIAEAKAEVATEQAKKATAGAGLMAAPTQNNETHLEAEFK